MHPTPATTPVISRPDLLAALAGDTVCRHCAGRGGIIVNRERKPRPCPMCRGSGLVSQTRATVRIGNGRRVHPALVAGSESAPGMPWNRTTYRLVDIVCGCPDCANGHARQRASIVRVGDDAWDHTTCGSVSTGGAR